MSHDATAVFLKEWEKFVAAGSARHYAAGEIIFIQDEKDAGLICICKGTVKNCVYLPDGSEKITCIFNAPSFTGYSDVIDGKGNMAAAVAVTAVEAFVVPAETAWRLLPTVPYVMAFFTQTFLEKVRGVHMQATNVSLTNRQKLAHMLVHFRPFGMFLHVSESSSLSITHEQLANFLGITRSQVSRILGQFQQEGLLQKARGRIAIRNYAGLQAMYE